ncbi:indole-3-glycerol phosphate synthase TrpC [Lutimonas sp.]|uniref:indole-3-glycerol phosphate synthase TrpC n=1 Tax=Lutimonas sp. TaxID=1872403 RepID=UPI003D9B5C09
MNILERIVKDKKQEVAAKKNSLSLPFLVSSPLFDRTVVSMSEHIITGSGVISEFKRRSPSKQVINHSDSVIAVTSAYEKAGASAISVLTDTKYFGGAIDDLIQARNQVNIPLLRKEFIIEPYQIYEAKAYGADAILLIAAILTAAQVLQFSELAHQLGLEVLLEVHNKEELDGSPLEFVDLVGVNNRNLKTFEVSLETSKELAPLISKEKVKISESGISSIEAIHSLKEYDYKGFLIGENFMKMKNPGAAATEFINAL